VERMSKKCGECSNFDRSLRKCNKVQDDSIRETDTVICCPFYELRPPTFFDRISASPEVLAPHFLYHVTSFLDGLDKPRKIWYSTLINNQYFNTELEAKRATVAKLKKVEK
jgi:hypothetical protein